MTVYVDLVFLINFIIDFYILSGVKFILKRNTKNYRIILGTFVGSLSIFLLFFKLSTFLLNLYKIQLVDIYLLIMVIVLI